MLRLNVPIYGTMQAASCFYKELVRRMKDHRYERLKADPCLYFVWKDGRLAVSVSWVDDFLIIGEQIGIDQIKVDLSDTFICKFKGELKEYIGNKIDFTQAENGLGTANFTQPVLVQKLEDEFNLPG